MAREIGYALVGIGLLVYEVLSHEEPRTPVLVVSAALLGLPVAKFFNRAVGE